jgi:hypothetical protein
MSALQRLRPAGDRVCLGVGFGDGAMTLKLLGNRPINAEVLVRRARGRWGDGIVGVPGCEVG